MTRIGKRIDEALSLGQHILTRDELKEDYSNNSNLSRALKQEKAENKIIEPRSGFYVLVPPSKRIGGPSPQYFIDALMEYEDRDYYVGLLSAAETYGVSHQAPQIFQVLTPNRRRSIDLERTRIDFIQHDYSHPDTIDEMTVETGTIKRSTPEATIMDCIYYQKHIGGMNRLSTLLTEFFSNKRELDHSSMIQYGLEEYGMPVVQRVGYLAERLGNQSLATSVNDHINPSRPTPLDPRGEKNGDHKIDDKFRVIRNVTVDQKVNDTVSGVDPVVS